MVRIGPSNLLCGESGLFARENIIEGTVVASFGAVRALRKGEVGTRTRVGYSFFIRETGGRSLEITPRQGITEEYLGHAINHTCHPDFQNCKFLHTGVTKDPRGVGQGDEGGVGGSRTSVVSFSPTMGIPSGFLMGVSVICVRRRRHDAMSCVQVRVRTDQVQCDIFTEQYNLFNFSVNKFISGVNTYNPGVNSYPNGVNPVSRVIQTI